MAVRFYSKNITATNPNSFHESLSTENPLPLTLNNSSLKCPKTAHLSPGSQPRTTKGTKDLQLQLGRF